jgi:hypothetical protein
MVKMHTTLLEGSSLYGWQNPTRRITLAFLAHPDFAT